MPATLEQGKSTTATFVGLDQFGKPFAIDFTQGQYQIAWVAQDGAIITVTQQPDGTAKVEGAAVGSTQLEVNVKRPDGVVVSAADSVSVTAPTPVLTSGTIQFS